MARHMGREIQLFELESNFLNQEAETSPPAL